MRTFQNNVNLKQLFRDAPFTTIMLILNIGIYLLDLLLGWLNVYDIQFNGILWGPFVVELGQYYRVITSAFLHGSLLHILSNSLIGLYILTAGLERLIGTKKTIVVYVAGMLLASGLTLVFNYATPTLGASGAIFGALGSLLYVTVYRHDLLNAGERRWILQLIGINVIFTLLVPGISITGHLGGLLGGYLISYLLIKRDNRPDDNDIWDYTH